jgi:hypothetical protein
MDWITSESNDVMAFEGIRDRKTTHKLVSHPMYDPQIPHKFTNSQIHKKAQHKTQNSKHTN